MVFTHKHTGNEWYSEFSSIPTFSPNGHTTVKSGEVGTPICVIPMPIGGINTKEKHEANVKLIENAPKLVQIAEMFHDHLGSKESIVKNIVTEVLADIGVFGEKTQEVEDKVAETKVEYNVGLIGAFMEHYKEETGKEIPESVFNSFFNV